MVIGSLPVIAKVGWLKIVFNIVNDIIVVWKGLEYSQAIFVYRDHQEDFLGQSMRHAITASRRLMGGNKASYLIVSILFIALPMLTLGAIFGGIAFYGDYTGTYPLMWAGVILLIIAELMFIPVALLVAAQFYQRIAKPELVADCFTDTFKPVDVLTGSKYADDWRGVQPKTEKLADPQVKTDSKKKTEAKKDE